MALKTFKPYTKSTRGTILVDRTGLWKGKPFKSLVSPKNSMKGRNNNGHITSINRAGGHKKMYRHVDFYRKKFDMPASVERIEYDPNRSAFIALIDYQDLKEYIIAPSDIKSGDKVISSSKAEISSGNAMKIKNIPTGTSIHNIELKPGAGGKLCRSAGSFAQVLGLQDKYIMIKLSSRETRLVHGECMATVGVVSNQDNKNKKIGKAGIKRHLGIRPTVRGVVMNPVDHPHGGGEGRTSGGRHPSTPWGMKTKGKKTRKIKFTSKMIISRRAKK